MHSLRVELGVRAHTAYVGIGLLDRLGELTAAEGISGRCAVVTDTNVSGHYLARAIKALASAGFAPVAIEVEPGEPSKSIATLAHVYGELIEAGLDRSSAIVALGGGVVGDLAGFAAATYLRGVPLVQVPTTVLAQVDSALGGKTAVDHPRGKNLIGAFYQPRLIVADVETLDTLSLREFREGLAEVIKYGAIMDEPFVTDLERSIDVILSRDKEVLEETIFRCLKHKASVVERDERESELRAILNFGHTVGHALEASAGYGHYLHGEAVAIGMNAAAKLSCRHAGLAAQSAARLRALTQAAGLPVELPSGWLTDGFRRAIEVDKKRSGATIGMILLERLGKTVKRQLPFEQIVSDLTQD